MRRTLLLIPHELAGIPVFGVGWVLLLIVIALVVRMLVTKKHGQRFTEVLAGEGFMWGVVTVAVILVLPRVELVNAIDEPVGMAIRGYGVFLIVGVSAAVGMAAIRAKNRLIDPEVIFALAPWVLVGGIAGARIFYLVQYRQDYDWNSLGDYLGNLFSFTRGGLVVYGSMIGAFLASLVFIYRNKLPLWRLGDAIIPCIFIGVFFGRMGCLMNGCCYGGRCEDNWLAIYFPQGSPVYGDQLTSGELLGMKAVGGNKRGTGKLASVTPNSLADAAGITAGQVLNGIVIDEVAAEDAPRDIAAEDVVPGVTAVVNGTPFRWAPDQLPQRALPVQAAQLISSVSALVLCLLLCGLSYFFKRAGAVMLLGFAGYAVLRFVLELVRVDEAGQFGTGLTISQWVSVVVFVLSIGTLIWLYRQPQSPSSDAKPELA